MTLTRYKIFALTLLLSTLTVWADVKLHGRIIDEKNEPLEFVTVRIAGTAIGGTSGLNGDYALAVPEADTVKVIFTCLGYKELTRELITPKGDVTLNVSMQPNSKVLKEVEISEIKKQTSTIQQLDSKALKLSPDVSGGSVEALISTMAGVNSNNEMSSQYSVRGGTYDENSVRINGVDIYRPQLVTSGQQEGMSVINPDMVGSIGFSTGGFSAEYGDKMSSALDITYREPEAFEGAVNMSLMGGGLTLGQSSKKFSQLYGFRYKSNSSLLGSMDTKGEYDPKFIDFQTNITYKPSSKWRMSILGNVAVNNYKFTPTDRTTTFGTSTDAKQFKVYFDGWERDRFETWLGAYSLTFEPSKKTNFTLLASGYLTNELVAYDISGEYWLDQAGTTGSSSGESIGGELGVGKYMEHARNRLKASVFSVGLRGNTGVGKHSLLYGVNLNSEKIMDRTREWELRDSSGYSLPVVPDALKMIYNLSSHHDLSSTRFSAFIQDTYRLNTDAGYFSFNAGVRLSHWSFNSETLFSPRMSVAFMPEKGGGRWAFRLATGLYYQAPFYKEFRVPVEDSDGNTSIWLNNEIKSPRSFQLIGGADYTFRSLGRPFKLSGEVYYKKLDRMIPYEVDNLKVTYSGYNTSNGFTAGLDMKLFGQFVPGTDSWISFSLMKTQENLNGVNVPLPTDQRYSFAAYFTDFFPKYPRLKFSLRGIFSDGLPTTAPRSSRDKGYFRTPAYKRIDVGLSYALVPELSEGEQRRSGFWGGIKSAWLGVDLFNMLDIANVNSYYWVTDVNSIQYAVPNYLTRRQVNVRLSVNF